MCERTNYAIQSIKIATKNKENSNFPRLCTLKMIPPYILI